MLNYGNGNDWVVVVAGGGAAGSVQFRGICWRHASRNLGSISKEGNKKGRGWNWKKKKRKEYLWPQSFLRICTSTLLLLN